MLGLGDPMLPGCTADSMRARSIPGGLSSASAMRCHSSSVRNGISGMQQPQHHLVDGQQIAPVRVQAGVVFEAKLLQFEIPVAELMPDEVPQRLRGFVKAIGLDGAIH